MTEEKKVVKFRKLHDEFGMIRARARSMGTELAGKEYARLKAAADARAKSAVKVYLDEYGNEVHVKGPIIDRVRKVETLRERIQRYDRLAAAVHASRQAMQFIANEMGVIGVDKHGQPIFADGVEEDPTDFEKLADVQEFDEFGDIIEKTPVATGESDGAQAAAPQSQAAEQPKNEPVADPVPQPETAHTS